MSQPQLPLIQHYQRLLKGVAHIPSAMGQSVTQPTYEKEMLGALCNAGTSEGALCKSSREHRCLKLDASGQDVFGSSSLPLKVFNTDPEEVLTLVKVML